MLFFLLLLLCCVMPVSAQPQWFDRHSEGWFWYEPVQDSEAEQEELFASSAIKENQPLSTAWIRKNIGQYLDTAIDHPSKDNVRNYLYLDRLVKEKAERFAHVGKQVIEGDPMLDENVRRPISPAAAKIKDDMAHQAKELALKKIATKAGIVFYYQGSCRLCHLQAKTVQLLQHFYGFEIISFSVDGIVIPDLYDSRIDKLPHQKLNIQAYPALFLMQPPDKIAPLRQGGISFTELSDRIIRVSAEHEWISMQEFNETRISKSLNPTTHLPHSPNTRLMCNQ